MPNCAKMPDMLDGRSISDLPELAGRLEEVQVDYTTWTTLYRCKVCGQLWKESYENRDHGDVPSVTKVRD